MIGTSQAEIVHKKTKDLIRKLFLKLPLLEQKRMLKELKKLTQVRDVYYVENCEITLRFTTIKQIVDYFKTLVPKVERGNIIQCIEGKRPTVYGHKIYKIKERL